MTDYPQKQPPRFVPTLTQTVEHIAAPASDTPAQPAALQPEPSLMAEARLPAKKLLEDQLEEKINTLIAKHLGQLEQEIREEIRNTVKEQRAKFFDRAQEDNGT